MAEDTCIFLISGWIRGDFTKFEVISGISRLQDHNTVLGIQSFFNGIQCLFGKSFFYTDTGQNTEALRLDIDLTFFTFLGTNFVAVCIVGSDKPFAIPAIF